jgi:phosphate-selective porin OprO/OprP
MQLFGRIHLDYWAFPNTDETLFPLEGGNPQDRFGFRRLRLGVKGNINDNMFYKYEGEFADGVEPSYRDAYIVFSELPILNTLIIGNQKRPYGLDHLNSSRYNVFMERPFVVEAFNQDSRRLGICSYGVSENLKRNWRFGVFEEELTQTNSGYIGDHYQLELAGRLAATPWYDESSGGRGYVHFGMSGSVGVPDGRDGSTNNQADYRTRPESRTTNRWLDTDAISGANGNYLLGLETVLNVGPVQVVGEYMRVNVDRRDLVGEDVAFDGVYVQASYFLTGEHMPWDRKRGTLARVKPFENFFMVRDCDHNVQRGLGAWQIAARYSHADLTDFDVIGGEGDSFTFGMNWYWNPYARMQFNYIYGDIDREPTGFGNYNVFGVRFMVDF